MLSTLIKWKSMASKLEGSYHTSHNGLSILKYADNTILFMDQDIEQANHMALLLNVFEP